MIPSAGPLLYSGWRRLDNAIAWSSERRQKHLVRADANPISVDRTVMPEMADPANAHAGIFISAWLVPGGSSRAAEAEASEFRQDETRLPAGHRVGLGFDVCDTAFTSMLSNTVWLDPDGPDRRFWSLALSQHHLFHAMEDAKAFCALATIAVPEHAPIVVVELFAHSPIAASAAAGRR